MSDTRLLSGCFRCIISEGPRWHACWDAVLLAFEVMGSRESIALGPDVLATGTLHPAHIPLPLRRPWQCRQQSGIHTPVLLGSSNAGLCCCLNRGQMLSNVALLEFAGTGLLSAMLG
jgi:hypothetical protein